MTQFIPYTKGKVYDPDHLRPFDLELAKQGHPLANFDGSEITHFFECGSDWIFSYHCWSIAANQYYYSTESINSISERLRLAPLAIKDGKPLHVGDVIEQFVSGAWESGAIEIKSDSWLGFYEARKNQWRWPAEEVK